MFSNTGLQGCDLESIDTVYRWFSCKQHLCAWYLPNKFLWDSTKNERPWRQWWRCKLQILGKHNCGGDLSVIFRARPPVHNNSIFTAAFSKKLTIASSSLMTLVTLLIKKSSTLQTATMSPPVEICSWFQTQVHQVLIHLLVLSTSPGSDSSSTCWHLCWQLPWLWRGGSSGSGSPPNSSFSLLTINTADKKAALSWPDLAWEVARRMQSHPKSWIPHFSGEAAALTVGCPLQPE